MMCTMRLHLPAVTAILTHMERIPSYKPGEGGENAYDQDRVRLTGEINSFRELDEAETAAFTSGNMTDKELGTLHQQREKAFDEKHEGYTRAQTEAILVNEQYYTKPNADPDVERAHQEKIKRLQDDLRLQMK